MPLILLRFYIQMFHIGLLFILFCVSLYWFLKDKNVIRFCFLAGIYFIGAFRPQLYIVEGKSLFYLYLNALFVDIGVIFLFVSQFIATKGRNTKKPVQ